MKAFIDTFSIYAGNLPAAALKIAVVGLFVALMWHTVNALTKFDDGEELFVKNNYAYFAQRMALCTAQIIGMLHIVSENYESFGSAVVVMLSEGFYVFLALLLVRPIVDLVVLYRIRNLDELRAGNLAVGIVEAGFYIGFGFILMGSLQGDSPSLALGLASTIVFAIAGLLLSIAVFLFHELVTPYKLRDGIKEGKLTAAVEVAGVLVAVPIVVRVGVGGDFTGWGSGFAAFFATAIIAVALLYLFRFLIDHTILVNCTVRSIQEANQTVAASLLAGLFIALAFPISVAVNTTL